MFGLAEEQQALQGHSIAYAQRRPAYWHSYLWAEQQRDWGSADVRNGTGVAFEKTPSYIRSPTAMQRIAELLPTVHLVVLLREPASRAYSHFRMIFATTNRDPATHLEEPPTFHKGVIFELQSRCAAAHLTVGACTTRLHGCSSAAYTRAYCESFLRTLYNDSFARLSHPAAWVERGVYASAFRRLAAYGFACGRVTVILSEEYLASPASVLTRLWSALGLPHAEAEEPDQQGAAPKTRGRPKLPMWNTTLASLQLYYRHDVLTLVWLLPALELPRWWPRAYFAEMDGYIAAWLRSTATGLE